MSNMFDMSATKDMKTGGKFLEAGIHNVVFKGIEKIVIQGKTGDNFNVMSVKFDIQDYGDFDMNVFEPKSAERTANMYGGENPSQAEQFIITCRHLLDTLNPAISKSIDEGTVNISAPTFDAFVQKMIGFAANFVDKSTKLKLLPQSNGFNAVNQFPAKLNKQGELYLSSKFIGDDLTLTSAEMQKIEKAKANRNSSPTDMSATVAQMSASMGPDMTDDLPF